MNIAYITHPDCKLHEMGSYHPECPERLDAIHDRLIEKGLLDMVLRSYDAVPATRDQLVAAHDASYVDGIFADAPRGGGGGSSSNDDGDGGDDDESPPRIKRVDDDTAMNRHTPRAALLAAGAACQAVDLVLGTTDDVRCAFCAVRPPGHHACRSKAMGSCFFNNAAVAAYHALSSGGLDRVAICDFDVHQGNGTVDIVAGDDRILFCSVFQHPFYPHGVDDDDGEAAAANVVNVPMKAGTDGAAFRAAVSERWWPRLERFEPELVIVSAGFDAHRADDLADFNLTEDDFGWITRRLCLQAQKSARGRVVSTLEGGYDPISLGRCVEAHINAMLSTMLGE